MDEQLIHFHRQYLQQIQPTNIRYPPAKLLVAPDIQDQIYRYFFDETYDEYLPLYDYQRNVLKKVISLIERELSTGQYDEDEYAISDSLMSHMGTLSSRPSKSSSESAQSIRTLSYYTPVRIATTTSTTVPFRSQPQDQHQYQPRPLQSTRILIREAPNLLASNSNVGLRTWEACLRLSYYMCTSPTISQHPSSSLSGSTVLELGAGTGLLSLICSMTLGYNTISTDGLTHVLDGIQSNIALNSAENITVARLDWTKPQDLEDIIQQISTLTHPGGKNKPKGGLDYILGADITYHPELFQPLASTIKTLRQHFPSVRVLIAATVRNIHTLNEFKRTCESIGLKVRDIGEDEWRCPEYLDQEGLFHEQAFPIVIMDIGDT